MYPSRAEPGLNYSTRASRQLRGGAKNTHQESRMLWLKAFHIVFVVTWFAGVFYLPRLFIYHAAATDRSGSSASRRWRSACSPS